MAEFHTMLPFAALVAVGRLWPPHGRTELSGPCGSHHPSCLRYSLLSLRLGLSCHSFGRGLLRSSRDILVIEKTCGNLWRMPALSFK